MAQEYNIKRLGDAIGLELEHQAQERAVGPFRADIRRKDTANDAWVLIENRLERSQHRLDHRTIHRRTPRRARLVERGHFRQEDMMRRNRSTEIPSYGFEKNSEWRQRLVGLTRRARGVVSAADARDATRELLDEFARYAYEIQDLILEDRIAGTDVAELVSPLTALTILLNRKAPHDEHLKREAYCRLRWPVVCDAQKSKREKDTTALCDAIGLGHGFMGKRVKPMNEFDRFVFDLAVRGSVEIKGRIHHSPWASSKGYIAALEGRPPDVHFAIPFQAQTESERFINAAVNWLKNSVFGGRLDRAAHSDLLHRFAKWDKRGDGKPGGERATVFWNSVRSEMRRVIASIPLLRPVG